MKIKKIRIIFISLIILLIISMIFIIQDRRYKELESRYYHLESELNYYHEENQRMKSDIDFYLDKIDSLR